MARFYKLTSSFIDEASFDSATNTLVIKFKSGEVSTYHGVPHWKFIDLLNADEPGSFYDEEIKGQYSGTNE